MTQQPPVAEIRTVRDQLMRVLALIRRSLRHFWKAVIIVVIGGGISAGVAMVKKKKWESSTVVLYRKLIHSSYIAGNNDTPHATSREVGLRLQELLLARPSLIKIIKEFKLYPKEVDKYGYVHATATLRKAISFRVGGGDTFHIAFTGPTPELAKGVVERLAEYLIDTDIRLRSEQARMTQSFLEAETGRAQKFLAKKERELAQFLAAHPEFAQDTGSGTTGGGGGGDSLGRGIAAQSKKNRKKGHAPRYSRVQLALMRQIARIQARLGQGPPKAIITRDPKFIAAKRAAQRQVNEARARLQSELTTKTASHPDVRRAQRLLATAKARLHRVSAALTASTTITPAKGVDKERLKGELARLRRRLRAASTHKGGKTVKADATTQKLVKLETRWSTLNRAVKESRERYLKLETRQFRAGLKLAAETGGKAASMQVVDPAFKPQKPIGLGRTATVAVGLALSVMFAGGLILLLGLMDDRLYDRLDVERLKVIDVLVEVPKGKRGWMKKKPKTVRAAAATASKSQPLEKPGKPGKRKA